MAGYGSTDQRKRVDDKHPTRKDIAVVVSCFLLGAAFLAVTAPTRPLATTTASPPQLVADAPITGCECTIGSCCERSPPDARMTGGCSPLITGFSGSELDTVCDEIAAGTRSGEASVCEEVKDAPTLGETMLVSFTKSCAELKGQCANGSDFDLADGSWSRFDAGCSYTKFEMPVAGGNETVVLASGGSDSCFSLGYEGNWGIPFYYTSSEDDAKAACEKGEGPPAKAYFTESEDSTAAGFCFDMPNGGSVTATITGGPFMCENPSTPNPTSHNHDGAAATAATATAFLLPALLV